MTVRPIEWFIQSSPQWFKYIVFLFIIFAFGYLVNNIILGTSYYCYEGKLIDNKDFSKCYLNYINAYYWKQNLSQEKCWTFAEASDPEWNKTVCDELVPTVKTTSATLYIWNSVYAGVNRAWDWIVGKNSTSDLYSRLYNPGKAMCGELYDCLSPDVRNNLNLFPSCEFKDGEDTEDNFPSISNFTYYTRLNKSIDKNMDEFQVFSVSCYEAESGEYPQFSFFGIPVLDWKIWLFLGIIGLFIWLIVKLGQF